MATIYPLASLTTEDLSSSIFSVNTKGFDESNFESLLMLPFIFSDAPLNSSNQNFSATVPDFYFQPFLRIQSDNQFFSPPFIHQSDFLSNTHPIPDKINHQIQPQHESIFNQSKLEDTIFLPAHQLFENLPNSAIGILPDESMKTVTFPLSEVNFVPFSLVLMLGLIGGSHWILKACSRPQSTNSNHNQWNGIWKCFDKSKKNVSSRATFLYRKAFVSLKSYAKLAQAIDSEKFSNEKFVLFTQLRYEFINKAKDDYALSCSLQKLQTAFQIQEIYQTIHQIELNHHDSAQQEFYDCVHQTLSLESNPYQICQQLRQKCTELLPQIQTKPGKKALQAYFEAINQLLETENPQFALTLFTTFQQHHLEQYTRLQNLSDLIRNLSESEMMNFKSLLCLVMVHYDTFEQLGQLIGISGKDSSPETYAKIIQYLALQTHYQTSLSKFEQLMEILQQWYPFYQALLQIRQDYPPTQFHQPIEFQKPIPGLSLYLKYQDCLKKNPIIQHTYLELETHSFERVNCSVT